LIPPKVATFTAGGKLKQKPHQFDILKYFNELVLT
jgi:hypothetical protein